MASHLDSNGNGIPIWLKAAYALGVPAIIALFMSWSYVNRVDASITSLRNDLTKHINVTSFYMRSICLNVAKDEIERLRCIPPSALEDRP